MPLFLKHRQPDLQERMDDPDCDKELLFNTYQSFKTINRLLSGWDKIYRNEIRPFLKKNNGQCSLLDIGVGGADVLERLSILAKQDGFTINVTAIDPDERSIEFAQQNCSDPDISFRKAYSNELAKDDLKFDFVISNHLLHHLNNEQISELLRDTEQLCSHKVLFNDIRRSDIGYVLFFALSKLFFHRSFVSYDGLISIKRSFTSNELSRLIHSKWKVERFHPFRLLLIYEKA